MLQPFGEYSPLTQVQTTEFATASPTARSGSARVKDPNRSRVTNGTSILDGIDQRSPLARRYRDILNAILGDQAESAEHPVSEARRQLCRRFASASVIAEQLETRLVNGEQIDVAEHAALSSTLVRLAAKIGIDRKMFDVSGPTFRDLWIADDLEQQREKAEKRRAAEAAAAAATTTAIVDEPPP